MTGSEVGNANGLSSRGERPEDFCSPQPRSARQDEVGDIALSPEGKRALHLHIAVGTVPAMPWPAISASLRAADAEVALEQLRCRHNELVTSVV
jgi:hypothetical protein